MDITGEEQRKTLEKTGDIPHIQSQQTQSSLKLQIYQHHKTDF